MTLRLLRAHLAAHAGSLLTVAALVLAISTLAGLMPRATTHVLTDGLRDQVSSLPAAQRDLTSRDRGSPSPGPAEDPGGNTLSDAADPTWGSLDDALGEIHDSMPQPLRSAFGQGSFAVFLPAAPTPPQDPDVITKANAKLSFGFDPRMADHITITKGRVPRPVPKDQPARGTAVEIVLSTTVARAMDWPVGQDRTVMSSGFPPIDVHLTGTYEARDASDRIWAQVAATLTPSTIASDGAKPVVTGVGWVEPGSYPQLLPVSDGAEIRTWFPLRTSVLTSRNSAEFTTQLREFSRQAHSVPGEAFVPSWRDTADIFGITELQLSSRSVDAVRDSDIAGAFALAMIALFASGPLGIAVALLVLAAGMVLRQQRRPLALAAARGASEGQLRALLGFEGLAIGLPSAAIGALIAFLLLPHDTTTAAWWWPLLAGLLPAALFAASRMSYTETSREDLTSQDGRSWRWTLELLVLLGAVAAIVVLRTRGLATTSPGRGVDPLLAGTPLLLSLAACLGVMRAYPWMLRQVLARVARWRGPTALLGTARALRDPAAGLAAVLAMVTSVGIAVFSGVAITTLQHGLAETARADVGSDVVIDGSPVPDELVTTLTARKDVREVVTVSERTGSRLVAKGRRAIYTTVILVDVAALRVAQHGVPGALDLPRSLERTSGDRLPVVLSEDFVGGHTGLELDGDPLDVVGTTSSRTALTSRSSWILADRQAADDIFQLTGLPNRLLVDTTSGAAVRDLARDVPGVLHADTPADARSQLEDSSLIPAVRRAALLALEALAVLCAGVIALTLVRGDASRSRQSALLGSMGAPQRRTRWLVAWEIGPLAVISLASGVVLGLVLPAVVLAGIDLRAFTAGSAQPSITIDPLLTAAIASGVLVVVVIGAVIAALAARRQDLSRTLRMMED